MISEFGNIDELIKELGLEIEGNDKEVKEPVRIVTLEEAKSYIVETKKSAHMVATAILLCITAPALLILVSAFIKDTNRNAAYAAINDTLHLLPLFLLIAIAVGMFIYSGWSMEKYKYIKEKFFMSESVKGIVAGEKEKLIPKYQVSIIIGIVFCIISPLIFIFLSSDSANKVSEVRDSIGVVAFLFCIAVAAYLITHAGICMNCYKQLLQEDEYSEKVKEQKKGAEKIIGVIAAIYWPIILIIYLLWSFLSFNWDLSWIVWPIAGIFFGVISVICTVVKDAQK